MSTSSPKQLPSTNSHVVDILGSTKGRDQPIMIMEKALNLIGLLDDKIFLDSQTVFFDPFCKAGEILLASAMKSCLAKYKRIKPVVSIDEIQQELYLTDRYYALAPDERHYYLSLRTFFGNERSHETNFTNNVRNGNYLSEIDGRLDTEKFYQEFNKMISYISKQKGNRRIIAVGNPPYQENYKGNSRNTGANPIYHIFLNALMESNQISEFLMVVPSRWFSGGRGKSLKDFAQKLKASKQVKQIYDFENSKEVFPTVEIKGGVCFLNWDSNHCGKTLFYNKTKNEKELIDLDSLSIIIRDKISRTIINKVNNRADGFISEIAWSWNPFGLPSNYFDQNPEDKGSKILDCYTKRRAIKKISKSKIKKNTDEISTFKVVCPKAVSTGGIPYRNDQLFIMNDNQVCTETYMVIDSFQRLSEAESFLQYLQTGFVRFLLSVKKITQDITKDTWSLVPNMERNISWNDEMLYDYFNLNETDINHITSKIEEWA